MGISGRMFHGNAIREYDNAAVGYGQRVIAENDKASDKTSQATIEDAVKAFLTAIDEVYSP